MAGEDAAEPDRPNGFAGDPKLLITPAFGLGRRLGRLPQRAQALGLQTFEPFPRLV